MSNFEKIIHIERIPEISHLTDLEYSRIAELLAQAARRLMNEITEHAKKEIDKIKSINETTEDTNLKKKLKKTHS